MSRVAVIGAGISGMAAAHFLSRKHQVFLFEKEHRLGGHTNTVMLETSQGPLAVDTGFIVHNDRTYPNLVRLLAELGVQTQPSDMSFGVFCPETGFEYSSRGFGGLFAQRSNLFRPAHYRLFAEILRFNREAPKLLSDPRAADVLLGEYIERAGFSEDFKNYYLYPMASAVWSMAPELVSSFPALTLVRFFDNHGMLGIHTHPKWKVIRGGSHVYIGPLTAAYRDRIFTGASIRAVSRTETGVTLRFAGLPSMEFDQVVFACHGDQVLPLLESPTEAERDVLGCFTTSRNETWLHTDSSALPRRPRARASWNYRVHEEQQAAVTLTYHMNRLQSLETAEEYCITLNPREEINPAKVLRKMDYHHPLYTGEAIRAQQRWGEISGRNRTHFCGAYWFYGFHEDGLNSALRVARALGVDW